MSHYSSMNRLGYISTCVLVCLLSRNHTEVNFFTVVCDVGHISLACQELKIIGYFDYLNGCYDVYTK